MAPSNEVLSSGSVVFALPHIRETISRYHAIELVKERTRQLDAIDRPVTEAFWSSFTENYSIISPTIWFKKKLDALTIGTNLLAFTQKLGLQLATYPEVLASAPNDYLFWLSACSVLGGSRKWQGAGRWDFRLEASPRDFGKDERIHEEPQSNPAEMLYLRASSDTQRMRNHVGSEWSQTEGLAHLLRDETGRIYLMRLLDPQRQPFFFQAARMLPEILYSDTSPFFPTYEVIDYANSQLGAVIWQCPPLPLSSRLIPDSEPEELRRILERAHDLFGNLAKLREAGISLNRLTQTSGWKDCTSTGRGREACVIPAYFQKTLSADDPGKLSRNGHFEERLPSAPQTAWPMAPLAGEGGLAGLPWSQTTAYNDPRVAGPRFLIWGAVEANWSDAAYVDKAAFRSRYGQPPACDRWHDDLADLARDLAVRLFFTQRRERQIQLLRSPTSSEAYESWLQDGVAMPSPRPEKGHSGLFTFCGNCVHQWVPKVDTCDGNDSRCLDCGTLNMVTAIPDAVRHLLLRILEPETREDGSKVAVTAAEAYQTMKEVLATQVPRLERVYNLFAEKQKKVDRMTTAGPLPLQQIRRDVSSHRWMLLEMLRGNLLDSRFTRPDHVHMRDTMVAYHAEKRRKDEEREAKREARRRGVAALPAVGPSNSGSTAPTPTSEAEVSAQLSTAPCEGAKRSTSAADEGTAVKKLKKA